MVLVCVFVRVLFVLLFVLVLVLFFHIFYVRTQGDVTQILMDKIKEKEKARAASIGSGWLISTEEKVC